MFKWQNEVHWRELLNYKIRCLRFVIIINYSSIHHLYSLCITQIQINFHRQTHFHQITIRTPNNRLQIVDVISLVWIDIFRQFKIIFHILKSRIWGLGSGDERCPDDQIHRVILINSTISYAPLSPRASHLGMTSKFMRNNYFYHSDIILLIIWWGKLDSHNGIPNSAYGN